VVVVAYTILGERVEYEVDGLLARAWQHETDHLNGILMIDRLDPTVLMTIRHRLRELELDARLDDKR
jgi:peptide deformylase